MHISGTKRTEHHQLERTKNQEQKKTMDQYQAQFD